LANNHELSSALRRLIFLAGISVSIYAINRLFLIQMLPEIGFLKYYLSDILALPVYLPTSLYLAWRLHLISGEYRLDFIHILGAVLTFSLLFEGIVPVFDATTTRDPYDVLAYFAGGLLVYIVGSAGRHRRSLTQEG